MFDSCCLQSFLLPNSVMYYITKEPSNPKGYEKLIQTCKYFLAKNSILVFETYYTYFGKHGKRESCSGSNGLLTNIKFDNTIAKLWIKRLILRSYHVVTPNLASKICPKLYTLDIKYLTLIYQAVYFEELQLFSTITSLALWRTRVTSKSDNSEVRLTKIFEFFRRLTEFEYRFFDGSNVAQDTVKELIKIPHFFKLERLYLSKIPESFDIETFYEYLKKNKLTKISLYFPNQIPHGYKIRLDEIADEIIQCESHLYKIPFCTYEGMSLEKRKTLSNLAKQQNL